MVHTDSVQITYSRWLFYTHLSIIIALLLKYTGYILTASQPLIYALGTLESLCLVQVLLFHVLFFFSINHCPKLFEPTVIYYSPIAWASIWILIMVGSKDTDDHSVERIGPLALAIMHVFIWYTRRTVIGVVVFERKFRASYMAYIGHRIYSLLAPLFVVWVWQWYPWVMDNDHFMDPTGASAVRGLSGRRLLLTMLIAGGIHVVWYSFISYAYDVVVWKHYLKRGVAVWSVRDGVVYTQLT